MHGSVIPQLKKPGRRPVSMSPYRKTELSPDAKIIVALLKKQPQTRDELIRNAHVSRSGFYENSALLKEKGYMIETEDGYALWTYVDAEKVVIKTIKEWTDIGFRYPTPMEIANETDLSPQEAEALARKTKDKTGWAMPNEGLIESAVEKLGEVLVCAARKRDGTISNFDYKKYPDDPEILEEAERFLKEHPEMLPKLTEDEEDVVSWPREALKYLGKIHKPKDRHITFVAVIRS